MHGPEQTFHNDQTKTYGECNMKKFNSYWALAAMAVVFTLATAACSDTMEPEPHPEAEGVQLIMSGNVIWKNAFHGTAPRSFQLAFVATSDWLKPQVLGRRSLSMPHTATVPWITPAWQGMC